MPGFIDNPVVSSLAGALGLGSLTSAGNTNPLVASATSTTPKVAPKASPPNQPEYKQARFFDPRSPQGSGKGGAPGAMPTEPGAMSPDVQNNPTVMDLLNHFGVHPQQQIDPGLFVHNANAWANHPVMSGVLDGLLGGLANTKGSDTLGEGLSNVAQGLEATHDQKIAHANAQLMMPYNQAMAVANLQDQVGKQSLQEAQQKRDISQSNYYDNLLESRQNIATTNANAKVQVAGITADGRAKMQATKPLGVDQSVYNANVKKHLNDIVAPGADPSDDDLAQASNLAARELGADKQAPKTQGAIDISNKTQANKVALKQTAPGSSAAAMISANKSGDAQTKATYTDADKELQTYQKMKPSEKAAKLGRIVVPGDATDRAELTRLTAARDAARKALPGGSSTPASSKYSSNNPYAPK